MKKRLLEKKLHSLWREAALRLSTSSALRLALRCGAAFAGAFLLAGLRLLGKSVPVALALLAAMPFSLAAVCAYLGAAAGYLVFWGTAGAFEPAAAGFLILAELCIFSGLLPRERKWFLPASACVLYALIGLLSLMSVRFSIREVAFFLTRLLLLAASTCVFSAAITEKSRAAWGALALCLLAGCSAIRLSANIPLSVVLAAGATFLALSGADALLTAAGCGLALDLTCGSETSMTAAFSLAALVCRTLPERGPLRAVMFAGCCGAGVLFSGGTDGGMLLGAFTGLLLAQLAPQELRQALSAQPSEPLEARLGELRRACDLMNEVSRALDRTRLRDLEPQSAAVFDHAAEQVCKSCARYGDCWQTRAADTYRVLSRAAERILKRGLAGREDFPDAFSARCCHMDAFLTAVNEALDGQLARRQYQNRLRESRSIVSDHFRALARLLQSLLEQPERARPPLPAYTPELGYRARGVRGGSVSGDHGSCFTCGEWYYLLLCDGMGTGEEASCESVWAIHFLSELILAGFEPQDAMQLLSGVYVLRGDGGFSTIDLLQLNLVTGEGFLHKWGAAASYLKLARRTMRLGSPTPPPGVGVDGRCRPECLRVSMGQGEILIMLSDGTDTERAEAYLRQSTSRSPKELAAGLLAFAGEERDDRTALALCLRPVRLRRKKRRSAALRALFSR